MSDARLTEQQRDALNAAYDLLGEHFEGSLIAVYASAMDGNNPVEIAKVLWSGGNMSARGLAREAVMVTDKCEIKDVMPD